ncbi:Wzz/FepE/Etk N-terminal domain-containing protein [Rhodanobacter sp. C03]|uniref:Wzz/FepE/Etk N-terminal domain-containing protein n=1 Tax=Rhodanobacter sp. C03 TaxID=1945858 RepID=UPI0009850101|nr:Wzz/FepE/Etk N-terminal domain-containing protein [Rhodanobacter sp. C03]OOG56563.1 lipopolysaccharide biosynthesis protein [Rhodanobacter sp. C03]
MEQDEIYLIDLWRIFSREWKWFAAVLVVALVCTFAFAHRARNQWEATAWIQIGQVGQVPSGQDPKTESLARVLERLQMVPFENEVMNSLGFSPDSPEASLYRKSMKLEPLPYAGPLIRMSLRGYSAQQVRQFAVATVNQLQAIHQRLEARPLQLAKARLDEIQADLRNAQAEQDRLQQAVTPAGKDDAGSKGIQNPLLASVLLTSKNEEIRGLQLARSDLVDRLSATYTYETSLLGSVYVPDKRVSPNLVLIWGAGLLLGAFLGGLAAMARNAVRRRVHR